MLVSESSMERARSLTPAPWSKGKWTANDRRSRGTGLVRISLIKPKGREAEGDELVRNYQLRFVLVPALRLPA